MTTTYMSLLLPTVSSTIGPDWATLLNAALASIDSHDHTPGFGKSITASSLNINADLTFGGNDAIHLRATRYDDQDAVLAAIDDLACIYSVGGDLYWNNGSGTPIQLTAGGALNAASIGGIGGDYSTSTASLFYTNASDLFTFWKAANSPAQVECGPITLRYKAGFTPAPTGSQPKGITLACPSLANAFTVTFPAAPPAATKLVTMDSSGTLAVAFDVDNSTLEVSSNTLRVKDGGIGGAKLNASIVDNSTIQLAANVIGVKPGGVLNASIGAGAAIDRTKMEAQTFIPPSPGTVSVVTVTLTGNLSAGNYVQVGAVQFAAVVSGATGNQFNIGGTAALTAENLIVAINASVTAGIVGVIGASRFGTIVTIFSLAQGTTYNGTSVTKSGANITLSAATMTGGSSGGPYATVISGSAWVTYASGVLNVAHANRVVRAEMVPGGQCYMHAEQDFPSPLPNQYLSLFLYIDGVSVYEWVSPVSFDGLVLTDPVCNPPPAPAYVTATLAAGRHVFEWKMYASSNNFRAKAYGTYMAFAQEV